MASTETKKRVPHPPGTSPQTPAMDGYDFPNCITEDVEILKSGAQEAKQAQKQQEEKDANSTAPKEDGERQEEHRGSTMSTSSTHTLYHRSVKLHKGDAENLVQERSFSEIDVLFRQFTTVAQDIGVEWEDVIHSPSGRQGLDATVAEAVKKSQVQTADEQVLRSVTADLLDVSLKLFWNLRAIAHDSDSATSSSTMTMQGSSSFDEFMTGAQSHYAGPAFKETRKLQKGYGDAGFKYINDYVIVDELGRGSYGKVKLAIIDGSNEQRAIKVLPKKITNDEEGNLAIRREVAIMKKLRHKHLVRLFEVIDDPSTAKIYLVMQYIDRGPLLKLSSQGKGTALDVDIARGYMRQLLMGLTYLHNHRVVHRDIKPENILVDAKHNCYLADFGQGEICESDEGKYHFNEAHGTPLFLAPELVAEAEQKPEQGRHSRNDDGSKEPSSSNNLTTQMKEVSSQGTFSACSPSSQGQKSFVVESGFAVDVWALGATFYAMLYGEVPFYSRNVMNLFTMIRDSEPSYASSDDPDLRVDPLAVDLLKKMLKKDPYERPTAIECGMHPFISRRYTMPFVTTTNTSPLEPSTSSDRNQEATPSEDAEQQKQKQPASTPTSPAPATTTSPPAHSTPLTCETHQDRQGSHSSCGVAGLSPTLVSQPENEPTDIEMSTAFSIFSSNKPVSQQQRTSILGLSDFATKVGRSIEVDDELGEFSSSLRLDKHGSPSKSDDDSAKQQQQQQQQEGEEKKGEAKKEEDVEDKSDAKTPTTTPSKLKDKLDADIKRAEELNGKGDGEEERKKKKNEEKEAKEKKQ